MCGRFALTASPEQIALAFSLAEMPTLAPRYNIAPSQPVAAVRLNRDIGQRELTHFHWGLIPSWAKDPAIGYKMINARSETAAEKPSFRNALKYRRCLVPVSGFYEWQKVGKGKQPHYIHLAEQPVLAIAGLWEHWQSADGSEIESCTLLTTTPNELMRPLHDRMPVILHPDDYTLWLNPQQTDAAALQPLFRPFPAELMTAYPVSTLVNSPMNDRPECVMRVGD
ncbi:MAG: SOS response-associated peptidase [Anaerolineae bacterium]|nr:SOS response-associated peptidase [Anaerolineae bacterium]